MAYARRAPTEKVQIENPYRRPWANNALFDAMITAFNRGDMRTDSGEQRKTGVYSRFWESYNDRTDYLQGRLSLAENQRRVNPAFAVHKLDAPGDVAAVAGDMVADAVFAQREEAARADTE